MSCWKDFLEAVLRGALLDLAQALEWFGFRPPYGIAWSTWAEDGEDEDGPRGEGGSEVRHG